MIWFDFDFDKPHMMKGQGVESWTDVFDQKLVFDNGTNGQCVN